MSMTLPAASPAPDTSASLDPVLRVIIALIGLIEGFNGLSGYPALFGDISNIPGSLPGGLIILTSIVLHPLLAFAGFGFALSRLWRYGIIALGLLALTEWADAIQPFDLSFELSGSAFVNATAIFKFILQPVIGLAAIVAAWRERYLAAATVGVMLPSVVDAAGVVAFAIGVMIHGF